MGADREEALNGSKVSPHFTLREMTRTTVRRPNIPDAKAVTRLRLLCLTLLEPARDLMVSRIGRTVGGLRVSSGYRSFLVNALVGGSRQSAHLEGRAADFEAVDPEVSCFDLFTAIEESALPYDKLIFEAPADCVWVHAQIARDGTEPRRLALMCLEPDVFLPWNPAMVGRGERE